MTRSEYLAWLQWRIHQADREQREADARDDRASSLIWTGYRDGYRHALERALELEQPATVTEEELWGAYSGDPA